MPRFDDGYSRDRPDRSRDRAPYPPSEAMGAYGEVPRISSPGHTTYAGPSSSQARLAYEPQNAPGLQALESRSRSRSRPRALLPPVDSRDARSSRELTKERRRSRRGDDDDDDASDLETSRTPAEKARGFLNHNFTDSPAGLGVGVLGALVGGLAAKEASDVTSRHNKKHRSGDPDHKRNQMISTAVGAVVGALGANVFEKRLEENREKERAKEEKWERKWRPDGKNGRVMDKTEIIARPRSRSSHRDRRRSGSGSRGGSGRKKDWGPWDEREREHDRHRRGSGRGLEREVDTGVRSWKDVEDWVYDDAKSGGGSRPSLDEYRY